MLGRERGSCNRKELKEALMMCIEWTRLLRLTGIEALMMGSDGDSADG